ncbi:MAG: NAD(P)H-hydrate dehydratase [Eubacteriales bacterium]|nr:NAD(P)H-hydrate dehydratase [Eubacteriales bacterium]
MKYVLDAKESKEIDRFCIEWAGIPSLVLMERAALAVSQEIIKEYADKRILCVCGAGNNGADGLAVARQLSEAGVNVSVLLAAGEDKEGSREYEIQKNIIDKLGIKVIPKYIPDTFDMVVDALFGIGLSRDVTGAYAQLIQEINEDMVKVIAVDIPSGINASSGAVMNVAVKAVKTVTFGYLKLGLVLYPGAEYAGNVVTSDIGFVKMSVGAIKNPAFTYNNEDLKMLPLRAAYGNKGTFGKVLAVAGSRSMAGAAVFSGLAAYRCGCGLVKLLTHEVNHDIIATLLPEALMSLYTDTPAKEQILSECRWASCIILGPGLAADETAVMLTKTVLEYGSVPVILDADGLNAAAANEWSGYGVGKQVIVTPHIGEMARLMGRTVSEIKENPVKTAKEYAKKEGVVCVLKDARTIVTDGERIYINTSGSDALATGGSGDALTGVIAAMITLGMPLFEAAAMGCFIHGRAGEAAGRELGNSAVLARDIADYAGKVIKDCIF